MNYKELKDDTDAKTKPKPSDCVAYADIVGTLVIAAMLCATFLMVTSMWVNEHEAELEYLRGTAGSNP